MPDGNILAHTTRALQVACELKKLGHEVRFATDGKYVPLIQNAGFPCEPHLTLDPEETLEICRQGRTNFYSPEFLARCVEEDCRLFERVRPNLILSDFRLSVSTSAEIAKIPHAEILNGLWTNYFTAPLTPPEGTIYDKILGRAIVSRFPGFLVKWIKALTLRHDVRVHNQLRRHYGLPLHRNLFDLWEGDINLIADIPEFAPTRHLPSHFTYVGPLLWQPSLPMPSWIDKLDPARPTLYITAGSSGNAKVFEEIIATLADTEYQCLVTTAGLIDLSHSSAKNVFVTDFAPGEALIRKSDLVICQGGNGTVYQALRAGVPIIAYPTMHDQHFNMDQVCRLEMGTRLSLLPFRRDELMKTIEETFRRREEYQARANLLASSFARFTGEARAAEVIDRFLGGEMPPDELGDKSTEREEESTIGLPGALSPA